MTELMAFISAAVIIEGLVSYGTMIIKDRKICWENVGAITIGCVLAFNLNLDIFALLGIEEVNSTIGVVLTGILISRGANYVYDLYDKLIHWKKTEE